MRTTDFSHAPPQAQAEAMVVVDRPGATRAWQRAARREAQRSDGHCWSIDFRSKDNSTRTRGVIACFGTPAQAAAFAALHAGRTGTRARLFRAESSGYSNGVWRAEGNTMSHVDPFTATSREVERGSEPPRVDGSAGRRRLPGDGSLYGGRVQPRSPVTAGAMFIGATKYRGVHSWLILSRDWYPMVAKMRRLRGYVWHTIYWEAPFTLGTLAFFNSRDDLLLFARLPEHRRLMQWITRGTANATGGYIRLHVADVATAGHRPERVA